MTMLQDLQRTVSRYVAGGRKRRQLRRELAQLDAMGSLDAVLADAGLVRSQIGPLIANCGDASELLDRMRTRLGVDAARLPIESLHDMEWACTRCQDKRRCRQWLSSKDETGTPSFCPNAAQLDHALWEQRSAEG